MRRTKGFSVIEILTTMVITAIIASISAPQYGRMRQESDFNDEVKSIFHTISQARANTIAQKKCNDDEASLWGVELGMNEFKLFCNNIENDPVDIETSRTTTLSSAIDYNDDPEDMGTVMKIVFLPETLQSKVLNIEIEEGDETEIPKEKVRIVLSHIFSENQKTICFHSIAGFPTLNTGETNCSD